MIAGSSGIDNYMGSLAGTLAGPRRLKEDLLAEARGSLADAAEAYQRHGLPRADAERRAIAEFGSVAEISPGFQEQLTIAHARWTARFLLLVFAAQFALSIWQNHAHDWWTGSRPATAHLLLAHADDWLQVTVVAGAAIFAALLGSRVRRAGASRRTSWIFGLAGLSSLAAKVAAATALVTLAPGLRAEISGSPLPSAAWLAGWLLPNAIVMVMCGRSLVLARAIAAA